MKTDETDTADTTEEIRSMVYELIRRIANIPDDMPIGEGTRLIDELGMDSLALMDLSVALESAFQKTLPAIDTLVTVRDCLRVADGQVQESAPLPPATWFARPFRDKLNMPGAGNIVDIFLQQYNRHPREVLLSDRTGVWTRRKLFLSASLVAGYLRHLPGARIGIMMPSVPATAAIWLAALLSGKTPVFLNWTTGKANLVHCIKLTNIRHIISAGPLYEQMQRQDILPMDLTYLLIDQVVKNFSYPRKALAWVRSYLPYRTRSINVPEVAAVLFTSGSEASPKAVPLTHQNLLSNIRDIVTVLNLTVKDSVLAMLPPFHSFGLIVMLMPVATGVRAVFHANPTESARLTALIADFQVSLLATPPTFLRAMLEQARNTHRLASVRYAFVGAEKCPESVYQTFASLCPEASLCEGYGITECSPAVAVNRPGNAVPGTVGHALPSVHTAIVREEAGRIAARAREGETGMLLVRGPSIFHGYLGDAPSPFVTFEGHSWYRTGDQVSMDENGRLTFQGRLSRFAKIGGEMISLPQIENILQHTFVQQDDTRAHPEEEEGTALAVISSGEDHRTEIVLFTPAPLSLEEVNQALKSSGLSNLHRIKRILHMPIPLLGSGKTDYQALKILLEQHPPHATA
jgi:acyl-CoA synthetase (AMP-forming)/AMP-acid ligase II/acyl carrier protein